MKKMKIAWRIFWALLNLYKEEHIELARRENNKRTKIIPPTELCSQCVLAVLLNGFCFFLLDFRNRQSMFWFLHHFWMLRLVLSEIVIDSLVKRTSRPLFLLISKSLLIPEFAWLSSLQVHSQCRSPPLGRDSAGHQLRARLSSTVPAESRQQDGVSEENDQGNTVTCQIRRELEMSQIYTLNEISARS